MSLSFLTLGVGDAFSARRYSSCVAVEAEGQVLLIDCPHPIRKMMREASESSGVPLPQAEEARAGSEAAARKERMKQRRPRVDWAELLKRTFDFDVFACVRCGGSRRVLTYVKAGRGVRAILEHLGLPTAGVSLAPAQESIQAAGC